MFDVLSVDGTKTNMNTFSDICEEYEMDEDKNCSNEACNPSVLGFEGWDLEASVDALDELF